MTIDRVSGDHEDNEHAGIRDRPVTEPQQRAGAVARLAGALERQADELRMVRSHVGLAPKDDARLLRPEDVAARLAKSRAWVYRNQHVLGGFRVGGQVRFEHTAIDAYLARCRKSAEEPRTASTGLHMLPIREKSRERGGENRPAGPR